MTAILAYDLGTGGCKAALYDVSGTILASVFHAYETRYPHANWHEQGPEDWWNAVIASTHELIGSGKADPESIRCIALSGQSLAVVPLDRAGNLLRDYVPIWSDTRPTEQVNRFFRKANPTDWYLTTGNGFSRETYSVFKIMWYQDCEPEMFARIAKVIGSKDFINFKLTGQICTDHSYASGSGVYNLKECRYDERFVDASGLPGELFPPIVESTASLGQLTTAAADALGLPHRVEVFCGGVDNSCMALGAGNTRDGAIYLSLGSSAWLAVSSVIPIVDLTIKPFVFAHVIPHMYTSATSVFSAGSAFRWLRDVMFINYKERAQQEERDAYDLMVEAAMQSPIGANGVFFNPSLAGGSAAYPNPHIRGAFLGLELRHTQNDLIRAVLEGIAFDLAIMHHKLSKLVALDDPILMVGGGSNSRAWRQIFVNIFNKPFARANVGQEAASLGAAAVAAVGSGLWNDFSVVDNILKHEEITQPDSQTVERYAKLLATYEQTWMPLSRIAELMRTIS